MEVALSILIATMPKRLNQLDDLMAILIPQVKNEPVEVIIDPVVSYNIGTKRNKLLSKAKGEYIVFIDDDDTISENYVWSILQACSIGNDCIGISGTYRKDMGRTHQWHISKEYGSWYEKHGVYFRTPNHISPVKRHLALAAGFPEISFGEDYEYSMRLLSLLRTETIINGNIYHYEYNSRK